MSKASENYTKRCVQLMLSLKMNKLIHFLFLNLLLISCTPKTHNEVELLNFKVKSGNTLELYKQDNFEESENWDIVKNLTVTQTKDTTVYQFEIFEGLCGSTNGKIKITNDTINLIIEKETAINELVLNNYVYKVLNPKKTIYIPKVVVDNSGL